MSTVLSRFGQCLPPCTSDQCLSAQTCLGSANCIRSHTHSKQQLRGTIWHARHRGNTRGGMEEAEHQKALQQRSVAGCTNTRVCNSLAVAVNVWQWLQCIEVLICCCSWYVCLIITLFLQAKLLQARPPPRLQPRHHLVGAVQEVIDSMLEGANVDASPPIQVSGNHSVLLLCS